jgi:hypothetical protein
MILAVAGRRIDGSDAKDLHFPLRNVDLVRQRVRALLHASAATTMVSSAACGADLIALSEARELRLRRRIILPFARERFRVSSVSDRPGNWGPLYDEILDEAEASGDLKVLEEASDEHAYRVVNRAILDATSAFMKELRQPASAVLAWDGASRGDADITGDFGIEAKRRGLPVLEVLTV